MDTPITASFRWTQEEYLLLQKILMRHSPIGRKIRRTMFTVGPFAVVMGVVMLATQGVRSAGIPFLVAGLAVFSSPWYARRINIKHYAQRPDRGMKVDYEFRSESVHSRTEASSGEIAWRMILRVLRTPRGFVFYVNDQVCQWVPIHAFPNDDSIKSLSTLIKSKVERYDEVA